MRARVTGRAACLVFVVVSVAACHAIIGDVTDGPEGRALDAGAEIYGNGGGYEKMKLAEKFKLSRKVASRITAPVGILSPELEQFFPGQSETMAGWLNAPHRLIKFTVAEGAEYHCEPMAPQLRNERVFDWLETNLRPVR